MISASSITSSSVLVGMGGGGKLLAVADKLAAEEVVEGHGGLGRAKMTGLLGGKSFSSV